MKTNDELSAAIKQFIECWEGAKASNSNGEKSITNALSDELALWSAQQGLECQSVDEMLLNPNLSYYQRDYLQNFEFRWDGASEKETEEDADEAALKELNEELHELMELQGFTYWQTGGGCTAWGKHIFGGNDNKSPYVMVTCGEDAYGYFSDLAQAQFHEAICVGFYDNEGVALHDGMVCYTWEEFKNNFKGGF